MIVALLIFIAAILLFGAGVVTGVLSNVLGYVCGGLILLMLALRLGSYFGEYGLLWVIGGAAALFGLAVLAEDMLRETGFRKPPSPTSANTTATDAVWKAYVSDIRERFDPAAQNTARHLFAQNDSVMLERFCIAEIKRIEDKSSGCEPST